MFLKQFCSHSCLQGICRIPICVLLLSVAACRRHGPSTRTVTDSVIEFPADSTEKNFFPIADYIRGEIHYVDSMPLALLKYTVHDNRTDSSFIRPDEFHSLARQFLLPELAQENFEKKYSQSSFVDQTSGYLTFTYAPRDKDLPLQRVDVLAMPAADGTNTNQIKSIYMQTATPSADTLIVKKMLWMAKKSFLIITSLQLPDKPPVIRQVKVVWDSSTDDE